MVFFSFYTSDTKAGGSKKGKAKKEEAKELNWGLVKMTNPGLKDFD